jgi:HEPN domain-containing protein
MANEHIKSARTLLGESHYSAAYHLAGLAVECALKAKVAKAFKAQTWPDRQFVSEIFHHDLAKLVRQADLELERQAEELRSPPFRAYWNTVRAWTVESRYKEWSPAEAKDMVESAGRNGTGVVAWIRRHW